MKKCTALLAAIGLLVVGTCVARGDFDVIQVPTPGVSAGAPVVNDNGQMAWVGYDGIDYDIYVYNGVEVLRLMTSATSDRFQKINNAGQVVWEAFDGTTWGVYFYDGTGVVQRLTADGCCGNYPEINDSGLVVWSGSCDPGAMARDIYVYNGTVVLISEQPGCVNTTPQINNNGDVVWLSCGVNEWSICFCGGSDAAPIFTSSFGQGAPQMNENGDVAWTGSDSSGWGLYFYDGSDVKKIDPLCYFGFSLDLNNSGQIVWEGFDGSDREIFLYDGQTVVPLTQNTFNESMPQINDAGYVVWKGFDGLDWEIFLYDGTTAIQVSDNDTNDDGPQITSKGTVAWRGAAGTGGAIFFAEPADTTPPEIGSIEAPDMLWPPNHKMVPVVLAVIATDDSGAEPACKIASVTSNEPELGCGSGDESPDWVINGDLTLDLRAERCGTGTDRIYTITVECADAAGNTATETVEVRVPHDMEKGK